MTRTPDPANLRTVTHADSAIAQGSDDLAKCPRGYGYKVVPVARIVEPAHGQTDWRLLVSFVFTKPGRYHLYLLKVDYVEGGQRSWDYVRADIPVRKVSPQTDPRLLRLAANC